MSTRETVNFETRQGADQALDGFLNWEWFKGFEWENLLDFVFHNSNGETTTNELVAAFLIDNRELPADYSLDFDIDELCDDTKHRYDPAYGALYSYSQDHKAYLFVANCRDKWGVLGHLILGV